MAIKARLGFSFENIQKHSSLPLFEIVLFCSLVIGSDALVLVRRSRVLWCIARLEVVVSWEAFAHEFQHPWEGDKKLQGNRPTGLD